MSLVFVDRYGAPDYGIRKGTKGVILHTTEGTGRNKAAALATAAWQAGTGNTSGGSYNYLLGIDGEVVTAVRSVHPDHAAGGISTRRDYIWKPIPELFQFLGATAVNDPNAWVCQIAIQGQTAWYEANGWPKAMVDALALLLKQLENRYGIPDIYTGAHYYFQTNRSDPGKSLIPQVIESYKRQFAPEPTVPVAEESRLDRLIKECLELRAQFPAEAERWWSWTGLVPNYEGPLDQEKRVAAEVTFLREVKARLAAADASDLRDQLSAALTEIGNLKANIETTTSQLNAANDRLAKKNAAIDAARAV